MLHVMKQRSAKWVALLTGIVTFAAPVTASTEAPFKNAELRVRIGGYWTMRLAAVDGVWEPLTRSKPSFSHVDFGYVTKSEGTPEKFSVSMQLRRDGGAHSPGHVFYDMTFHKQADGTYAGTCTETVADRVNEGEIAAYMLPEQSYAGHEPVKSGAYPRLLLRSEDIDALRQKAKTPLGKAFIERARDAKDPVVLGTLYQATGDKGYALEALRIVQGYSAIDSQPALTGDWGHQLVRVVLTIDLCHDAWPDDYRDALKEQVRGLLPKRQYALMVGHANYNQVSNYYGPGFGSAAIASLLLKGEKGAAPDEPVKPLAARYADCKVPPLKDYTPPAGVPVVKLVNDKLPKDWIYVGGFEPSDGKDLLAPLGGIEKARPTTDDVVTDGKKTARFRLVSHEKDKGYYEWGGNDVIDVSNAIGRLYFTESYFYTVVENDTPGWYEFNIGKDHLESATYLNGVPIEQGHVVQLDKGLYTILTRVRIGQTEPWGREMLATRFTRLKDGRRKKKTVDEINKAILAGYDQAVAFWKTETAEWKARDGENLECLRMFHKGREQMYQHLRFGVGDGGFQAEVAAYGNIAAHYPLFYATLYRHVVGRDVSPYPDATHVLPRQMMQTLFNGPRPLAMPLNVKPNFNNGWCANNFPVVPEKWKPHVLWAWNTIMDIQPTAAGQIDDAAAKRIMQSVGGNALAATFINYPLDMAPVHPSRGMPKTWAADTLGYYVFRSGWAGDDEFIAQVFTKSIPIRAWNHPNAGAFRLYGLGHRWTSAPIERSGYRPEESIVLMQQDVINQSACGIVTDHAAHPDGSGSLAINMAEVYMAAKDPKKKPPTEAAIDKLDDIFAEPDDLSGISEEIKDTPMPDDLKAYYEAKDRSKLRKTIPKLYNWWGERRGDVDYKSHIDGRRAIAFDYSGKSGAPCMVVLVDDIQGGRKKQWQWQLPDAENMSVDAAGQQFTVAYPDASMRGTILSPTPAGAKFMPKQPMHFIYAGGSKKGALIERVFDFVSIESNAKDELFFVIVTIQRDNPPQVKVTGKGKDAVATVGDRRVWFRDGKIIIE